MKHLWRILGLSVIKLFGDKWRCLFVWTLSNNSLDSFYCPDFNYGHKDEHPIQINKRNKTYMVPSPTTYKPRNSP